MKKSTIPQTAALILLAAAGTGIAILLSGCAAPSRGTSVTPMPHRGMSTHAAAGPLVSGPRMPYSADSFYRASDELWIIARPERSASPEAPLHGHGSLEARLSSDSFVPMPLKHTAVKATVAGFVSTVEVTQEFLNPYDAKIEAVYTFPLPHNAAIHEFIMTIGERRIRGIIRERADAEQIYASARRQGYTASLLTQQRPNVFTQSVANIEPGRQIDVNITYIHTLAYSDGWHEFVFPMVVGPRFNPPGTSGGIGALPRGARGTEQETSVHYLRPEERSGHDIALTLEINAGVPIEDHDSPTHRVATQSRPEGLVVELSPHDNIPNRDFVFRYRVAGDEIRSALLTHRDDRGGFFTLMVYPPRSLERLPRTPLEMVFVLDCSGSMSGRPLQQAKAAIKQSLLHLEPGDTFQLIRFSNEASQLGRRPLAATPGNIERGLRYLDSLNSEGGTMMLHGIRAALDFPHDRRRLRFVAFMTDGYIGNETEILGEINNRIGAARIFSFGVGPAVNRYLLDEMARIGRGAAAYLGPDDSAADVIDDFMTRISHPALTDVAIEWGGWPVSEVFPRRMPDLFVGRPVLVAGRFNGTASGPVHITGSAGGRVIEFEAGHGRTTRSNESLSSIWARAKIAQLSGESLQGRNPRLARQITLTALEYNLVSPYTAFIAVDSTRRTEGPFGTTVPVAVPVPDGVRYRTTVP